MSDTPENIVVSPDLTATLVPEPSAGPPANDPLPGTQLGDYVVEKAVAWGGMGLVYRAVHPLIGRHVAVKVLRPNFASDPEQRSRFLKEAKAVAAIKHRGIIDIIGFGRVPPPDGRQYMVMESLEGESLEAALARKRQLSVADALGIADELLDALSAAHRAGVVHRDLKPANVFLAEQSDGTRYIKLIDFGLARVADPSVLNRHSGQASMMAGTPQYVSPEQAKGLAATPRTDLYCLGVMLFEMLTGRLPFTAEGALELLSAHLHQTPPRVAALADEIPGPLDDLIAQLLLKAPAARPGSADVVRQQIQRMLRQLKEGATGPVTLPAGFRMPSPTTEEALMVAPTYRKVDPADAAKTTRVAALRPRARWVRPTLVAAALASLAAGLVSLSRSAPPPPARAAPVDRPSATGAEQAAPTAEQPGARPALEPVAAPPAVAPPQPRPKKLEREVAPAARPAAVKPVASPPAEKGTVTVVVTLNGERTGAFIDLDGERLLDQAPTTLTLEARTYGFRVWRPGSAPVLKQVTIVPGPQVLKLELAP